MFMFDTPTPRRRRHLRLGEPEVKFSELSGPPRCSMLRLGEPLRLGVAKLRLGIPISFVSVLLPLSLTIVH